MESASFHTHRRLQRQVYRFCHEEPQNDCLQELKKRWTTRKMYALCRKIKDGPFFLRRFCGRTRSLIRHWLKTEVGIRSTTHLFLFFFFSSHSEQPDSHAEAHMRHPGCKIIPAQIFAQITYNIAPLKVITFNSGLSFEATLKSRIIRHRKTLRLSCFVFRL